MEKHYSIAIIGFGSIAKRHLRNIAHVLDARNIGFSIDLIRRNGSAELDDEYKEFINSVYYRYGDVPKNYDVIFVTNPSSMHYETICAYSKHTKSMFVEKPIFHRHDVDLGKINLSTDNIYYVACPLRYNSVVTYLKNYVDIKKVYSARIISSSYLPDWRPGTDYRKTYSANKLHGGGVSIDLIHEWDYILDIFGSPLEVTNFRGKVSHLELDSDDISIYMAKYEKMFLELHLDYFGQENIRKIQLFTSNDTVTADLLRSEIRYGKSGQVINFNEERNDYQLREIEYFFDLIERKVDNINDINRAINTLKIAGQGV